MKNLIVTVGAIILILTITGYQVKCNKMLHNKLLLKHAADEGAATSALYFDREEYSKGNIVFDKVAATKAAREIVQLNFKGKGVILNLTFNDGGNRPNVSLELRWQNIKVKSVYEYV